MSADIYHRTVLRKAGAVHVGPLTLRPRHYLRDAVSYADGGLRHLEWAAGQARTQAVGYHECATRSLLCAVVELLRWGLS
jgi:hypothetical protein